MEKQLRQGTDGFYFWVDVEDETPIETAEAEEEVKDIEEPITPVKSISVETKVKKPAKKRGRKPVKKAA